MKSRAINTWFYGSLVIASWMFATTGLYLLGKNQNILIGKLMLWGPILLWAIALTGGGRLVQRASLAQLKQIIIFSFILFLAASLFLTLIILWTPDDLAVTGGLFYWEKIVSYGSLVLTLIFSMLTWYFGSQKK